MENIVNKKIIPSMITLLLIAGCALQSGDETKPRSGTFTATYQRADWSTYVLSGTWTGQRSCPPFQNGGRDPLVNCLTTEN